MSLAIDEYGNTFLVISEQESKKRLKGLDAQKANILAAVSISNTLKTSLGPKGMDKIICGPDNDVTVTNDGSTILSKMEVTHPCARLLVDLAASQDNEIGDGTTGVVILAGSLLDQAYKLLENGLHPLQISSGFDVAETIAKNRIKEIAVEKTYSLNDPSNLINAAMTSLSSKVVSSCQTHLSKIAVEAILSVADFERKDVNFELIKVEGKANGKLEDTEIIKGIVLDKDFSHPQMRKEVTNAKIAILTCPMEPPKPKTKHKLDITNVEDYKLLQNSEQEYFHNMLDAIKKSGANFVICQWGFDDEANHLLMINDIPAVRWVGGVELELIAIATGGRIVSRFEDLSPNKLGYAKNVREVLSGTEKDQMVVIEGCPNSKAVSVIIRGGNQMVIDEGKRSFHDAVCCVRNLIRNPEIVPGGGASELAASIKIQEAALKESTAMKYSLSAFANALLSIPEALTDNCGMNAVSIVTELRAKQIKENNPYIGIDCNQYQLSNMLDANIWETLLSKINQISLATQVVRLILKIDDVILPSDFQEN